MESKNLLGLTVREVMSTDLIIVYPDTLLKDVNNIFERENIHHVPVVSSDQRFLGIISKSDMLLMLDWGTKLKLPTSLRKNNFLLTSNLAKDMMETNVIRVAPDDTLKRCVQIFRENYFRALPVVDEKEQLVGLITTYDLMILAYTETQMIDRY
jgi:CBS domain-containing membrane protein